MSERGMAQLIRSNNGSKFIAKELQSWLEEM
jgi:transposase InsO family protein